MSSSVAPQLLPPLRRLLADPSLHLRLLTVESDLPAGALDQPVDWVHSSDLPDPTPFLSAGQMLLTTGRQFAVDTAADALYPEYVARLASRGIACLGFGTEIVRDGTPDALVAACLARGIPLVEVPYGTPFIAVARAAGELIAELRFARDTWTLAAQRAISLAALRPDGLSATLSELSRQLGHWVALFDPRGELDRVFPRDAFSGASASRDSLDRARNEAERMLRRGQRASLTVNDGGETLNLQTLGRRDQLRGVLALGGRTELDPASQEVVTSVIALAGLSLEQNTALGRARNRLRSGLLQALLGGQVELVRAISTDLWGAFPLEPVRVAVTNPPPERLDTITEFLELRAEEGGGYLFYARLGNSVVALVDSTTGPLLDELVGFGLHVGLSDPVECRALPRALEQARQALDRSHQGEPGITAFDVISRQGVLAFLATTNAAEVGRAALQPLSAHDAEHGTALLVTLRTWLECNGQFGPAAMALGVHRHTVRNRIGQAEALLGRDLGSFHERADMWAALLTTQGMPAS
ncbi:PucR family transcriptional regulator ligand-binding domain-containing protein [Cryobacterium psychrophilum]|uniref:PucR family transcriptional regulator n=1 Tax=Cryobacterium psychrophilum TaxID=41988 RepID=A0A4Y8KLG8_9MICO|nr:PucR family transcriptional regulator ligand-binding domain-containing protein [Cryobacterium psychrophilum]TDW31308.1 purine catabolism regulator [Cryobacterium psychrophilum]TFD78409.1 PucR family transcriptional regulator [Cryobacterium psychrophilum]